LLSQALLIGHAISHNFPSSEPTLTIHSTISTSRFPDHSSAKALAQWLALIPGIHEGYVSWERSEAIRKMVSDNVPTGQHHGALKYGDDWVRCRRCGRN